jgi:hypothetical protein
VCLTRLERFEEAEAALLEGHQILTAAFGSAHDATVKCVHALVALYDAWDRSDVAAEWQAKLDGVEESDFSEHQR